MSAIRSFVRPYITIVIITAIAVAFLKIVLFGPGLLDPDDAKAILIFVLGAAGPIVGFWFGERKHNGEENKPPTS